MKKIFQIATVACAALAIASCQTKLNEPVAPAEEIAAGYHMATLRAGHPASKAVMNGDASVTWQADDFVYVARSGEVIKFVPSDDSEGYEKEFHAPVADGETYTAAIYNRFGAVSSFVGDAFATVIPSAQNGESGNLIAVASEADVLDGSAVELGMVTSGFCFTVPGGSGVTSITLTVLDGTNPVGIAGNVTVSTDGTVSGADAKSVTVSKAFGASSEVVYIATAPLAYNKVRLAFAGTAAGVPFNYVKTAVLSELDGAKGCINNLGTVDFSSFTNTIITVDTQTSAEQTEAGKESSSQTAEQTTIEVNVAETVSCVLNDNTKQEAVINVSDIAEGAVLVVDSDDAYRAKDGMEVTINLPSGTPADAFEGIVINAPNAHVTVMVDGVAVDPATYFKNVTTSTADSTLVIEDGITIDNLTVLKGSVYVVYGATVGNITLGENAGLVKVEYYSNIEGVKRNGVDTYAGVVVNEWIDLYQGGQARIGETVYATLADAVAAAVDGDTIEVLADIDFSVAPYDAYKWAGATYNPLEILCNDITLELNGHTLYNMGNTALAAGHGLAKDGFISNFTLQNGKLMAGQTNGVTNSYVLGISGVNGASIKNVRTNGGINVYTASTDVVIEDCVVNGTKYYSVCAQCGSQVTIKNTAVTKNTDSSVATKAMFWIQGADTDEDMITPENPTGAFGASSITLESGSFKVDAANGGQFYLAGYEKPSVKGGIFSIDPTACLAEGYKVVDNASAEFPYAVEDAAVTAGEGSGRTLAEAVALVPDNGIIKLVGDASVTSSISLSKSIKLDLQGHTINSSAVIFNIYSSNKNLTITDSGNNGAIDVNADKIVYSSGNGTTITLEGGNLSAHSTKTYTYGISISSGANFVMTGGSITITSASTSTYNYCVSNTGNGTIDISGGNLSAEGEGGNYTVSISNGTANISGGTIYSKYSNAGWGYAPYSLYNTGGTLNVTGGYVKAIGNKDSALGGHPVDGNANITGGYFGGVYFYGLSASTQIASGYTARKLTNAEADPTDAAAYSNGYLYVVEPAE